MSRTRPQRSPNNPRTRTQRSPNDLPNESIYSLIVQIGVIYNYGGYYMMQIGVIYNYGGHYVMNSVIYSHGGIMWRICLYLYIVGLARVLYLSFQLS